jgi:hypothetical protein
VVFDRAGPKGPLKPMEIAIDLALEHLRSYLAEE